MKHVPELALKARLAAIPGIPKTWPNQDFDPKAPGNVPYIACTIVRAGTSDDTLDSVAPIVVGRLIATVVVLRGSGEGRANDIAEQVAALFPMGAQITAPGFVTDVIQPPHIREGMSDGAYWRVPVSVPIEISLDT
jgi:hypothetical protein